MIKTKRQSVNRNFAFEPIFVFASDLKILNYISIIAMYVPQYQKHVNNFQSNDILVG